MSILHPEVYADREIGWSVAAPMEEHEPRSDAERMPPDHLLPDYVGRRVLQSFINTNGMISHHKNSYDWFINMNVPHIVREYQEIRIFDQKAQRLTILLMKNPRVERPKMLTPEGQACPVDVETAAACKASYSCSIAVDIVELQYKVRDGEHVCANPSGKPTITSSGKVLRIFTSLNGAAGLERPAALNEQKDVGELLSFPPPHPKVPQNLDGGEMDEEADEEDPEALRNSECYGMIFMTRPRRPNTFGEEGWLEAERQENLRRRRELGEAGFPVPETPPGTFLQKPAISQFSCSAELDDAPARVDPRFVLVERVFYQNVEMCKVAAMVGSSVCYTSDEPPGPAAPLNRLGGFLIQNGAAKVMVPTLTLRPNRFFVFSEGERAGGRVSFHGEIRAEDGSKIRSTRTLQLYVETGPGGSGITVARIKINMLREPVPVWAWLRVLGYRSIPEAARAIAWGGRLADDDLERHPTRSETSKFELWIAGVLGYRDSSKSAGRGRGKALGNEGSAPPSSSAGPGAGAGAGAGGGGGSSFESSRTPDFSAMTWSEVNAWVSTFVCNDKPNLRHLIMSEFEPQNGFAFDGRSLRVKRRAMAFYLCRIFRVARGEEPHDNRDACFSLETPGKRLTHQLRLAHRPRMRALLSGVARMKESNRHVDAPTKFYAAQTTHHMAYAIRTGKWGQGKGGSSITGITHAVKRVNRVEIVSQMTAVQKNPESKKTKNIDPRLLPTEFWGLMCPSGTPEGESCGLTLYMSQGAKVVMGVPFEDMYRIIYAYLVREGRLRLVHVGEEPADWDPDFESTCALFIQGTFVGLVEDGQLAARKIRALRRRGLLPADVAVSHNAERSEVFVSCEHGTLRRPLFVFEPEEGFAPGSTTPQERMNFRRARVAEIRAVADRYSRDVAGELFRELLARGLVEFIDKDEENNVRISADASRDPEDEEIRYYDFWSTEEERSMAAIVPPPPPSSSSEVEKGGGELEMEMEMDQGQILDALAALHRRVREEEGKERAAADLLREIASLQARLAPISDSRAEELVRESRSLEASISSLRAGGEGRGGGGGGGGASRSNKSRERAELRGEADGDDEEGGGGGGGGGDSSSFSAVAGSEETAMGQGVASTAHEDERMRDADKMLDRLDRVMAELRCPVVFGALPPAKEREQIEEVKRELYAHSLVRRPEFVLDPDLHREVQERGLADAARRLAFPGPVTRPFHDDVVDRALSETDPEAHARYYRALRLTWMTKGEEKGLARLLLYSGICGGELPPELSGASMAEVGEAALARARAIAATRRRSARAGVRSSLDGLLDREVAQAVRLRARLDPDRAERIRLFWASSFRRAREARRRAMLQHRVIPEDLVPARGPHRGLRPGDVTHAEIHPTAMFGFVLSQSPFPDRNQGPRNTYTQAMRNSSYTATTEEASETQPGARLLSGEFPAVQPLGARQNRDSLVPHGAMTWCAFICTDGHNQEDSLIMSKGFVDSGKLRAMISTVTRDTAANGIKSDEQHFEKPDVKSTLGVRTGRLDKLEPGGYPKPGSMLMGGDYIIGKTTVARTRTGERTKMDAGTIVRVGDAPQVVESVLTTHGHDGYSHMSVRTRHMAVPQVGDKFATRNGQKGALSSIEEDADMPYMVRMVPVRRPVGPNGEMRVVRHRPQVIRMEFLMNTHAMPSRMTGSQMLEMYLSSLAAVNGIVVDATAFQFGATMAAFEKHLKDAGWDLDGRATLYSGITGEPLEGRVFCGPVDLMVLKQKVLDKFNVRARGPVTAITRQPVPGRQKLGALKLGEMERDNMLAHGASKFVEERFLTSSNPYETTVCKACGFIAQPGQSRSEDAERLGVTVGSTDPYCRNCRSSEHVVSVRTTYSSKQFIQTMMAMGVAPRLKIATSRTVDFEAQVAPGALPLCRRPATIFLPTADPPPSSSSSSSSCRPRQTRADQRDEEEDQQSRRKRPREDDESVVVHALMKTLDPSIGDLF